MDVDRMPNIGLARLAPPPGGERRLREALHDDDARGFGWRLPLAGACASLCMLALAYPLVRPGASMDAEIQQAVDTAVAPVTDIRVVGARVERIATQDTSVRIYRITDLPPQGRGRMGQANGS